ncbi:hypothetical protein [Streptomyces acidicola]
MRGQRRYLIAQFVGRMLGRRVPYLTVLASAWRSARSAAAAASWRCPR